MKGWDILISHGKFIPVQIYDKCQIHEFVQTWINNNYTNYYTKCIRIDRVIDYTRDKFITKYKKNVVKQNIS